MFLALSTVHRVGMTCPVVTAEPLGHSVHLYLVVRSKAVLTPCCTHSLTDFVNENVQGGSMAHTKACDLEAFCATCPSAQEVINLLQALGFELTFHMDIDASPEYEQVPPLPAQFHFLDKHGTEAIFLAGTDTNLDGIRLPEHSSRFWLYPGYDEAAFWWIAHVLSVKWSLAWRAESQARRHVA